jgi:hypothetical protein
MSRIETAEALRSLATHLERLAEEHTGSYCDGMYDASRIALERADELDPDPHPTRNGPT